MLFITDHFSFGMLEDLNVDLNVVSKTPDQIRGMLEESDWRHGIFDKSMAAVFTADLAFKFDGAPVKVNMKMGDMLILGSCTGFAPGGANLVEGLDANDLPDNLKTSFLLVSVVAK